MSDTWSDTTRMMALQRTFLIAAEFAAKGDWVMSSALAAHAWEWTKSVSNWRENLSLVFDAERIEREVRYVLGERVSNCIRCGSARLATVQSHSSDMCFVTVGTHEKNSYAPDDMGIGGGDDVCFTYCLDCGQMEGEWPLPKTKLEDT